METHSHYSVSAGIGLRITKLYTRGWRDGVQRGQVISLVAREAASAAAGSQVNKPSDASHVATPHHPDVGTPLPWQPSEKSGDIEF